MSGLVFESVLIIWVGVLTYFLIRSNKEIKDLEFKLAQIKWELTDTHINSEVTTKRTIRDEHAHFAALNCAIIYHLHASGTVHQSRIWDTYVAEITESEYFEDRVLPSFIPRYPDVLPNEPSIDIDDYNIWRKRTGSSIYADYPNERVDSNYIYELTES